MKDMTTCALVYARQNDNLINEIINKDDIFWSRDSKCHLFFDANIGLWRDR